MNPLQELKDIHLPEPIIWWYPQTIGWYIVALLLTITIAYLLWRTFKYRIIKKQINALINTPKEQRPLQVMMLLKAKAIESAPQIANRLQGKQWVEWLETQKIQLDPQWQQWLSQGYLNNEPPPKDWYIKIPRWLKKLS